MGTYEGFLRAPWCALWGPRGLSSTTANSQTQWLLTSSSAPCTYSIQCSTSYRQHSNSVSASTVCLIPHLHDTTGCQISLTTGCIVQTNIQPVVKRVWQLCWTNSHCSQPLYVQPVVKPGCTTGCIHDTVVCQTGCQMGLTTGWMLVYTIQQIVKPVYNRYDNRLYHVNGALECCALMSSVGWQERHLVCKHLLQLLPRVAFWPKME